MKNEKKLIEYGGRWYTESDIIDALERNERLHEDNVSLAKDMSVLKCRIGGYMTSNSQCKKRVSELEKQVEGLKSECVHYAIMLGKANDYGKEADELNEQKAALIDSLNQQINSLSAAIGEANSKYKTLESNYAAAKAKTENLERELAWSKRPWWKRIF